MSFGRNKHYYYNYYYCKGISLVCDHFQKAMAILGKVKKPLAPSSHWKTINNKNLEETTFLSSASGYSVKGTVSDFTLKFFKNHFKS